MEKKNNNTIKSNGKEKVVSSTSNSYNSIQPRVVLQRLSKDCTFGVATSSGNQPSTSGHLCHNKKSADVDSSVSVGTSENNLNTRDKDQVIPSSSKLKNTATNSRSKEVNEFKVAWLKETNPYSSSDDTDSECSFHTSPKEVIILDENKSEIEDECRDTEREKFGKDSSDSNGSEESSGRELTRAESKIQKAITFLNLLIDTYGRRSDNRTIEPGQPSTSAQSQTRRRVTRSLVYTPQCNNLKDCLVRVWLSISGQKKKKKFHVRLSQLISLLKNKNHPLHRFRKSLTLRTLKFLTPGEIRAMARVLSDFVCAKPVRF